MMKNFLTASLQQGLGKVVNRSSYLLPLQRKYILSLLRDTKTNLSMAAEWKHISYIKWDLWTFLSPSLWHLYHENLFAGSGETLFSSSFSSASHLSAHKTACGEFTRWERSEITALPTPTLTPAHQAMKERSVRYTLFGTPGWTSFFCPSCFKSSWLRFNKELETFLRAFGPRWLDSIMLVQIYRPHPWENVPFHHIPELWQDWDLWRPSEGSELRFKFEMLWALRHGALSWWKKRHKMVHWGHKGMDVMSSNTQVSCGV